MKWKIAEARLKFSELIRRSEKEPQLIYNRDKIVAAIVSADEYEELRCLKEKITRGNLASMFNELSSICAEESYTFEIPDRKDREVKFP